MILINPFVFGAAAGYTALNPADTFANITLSGGDLVATTNTENSGISRAVHGKSTGKHYFEAVYTTASQGVDTIAAGLATIGHPQNTALGYGTAAGWAIWGHGGSGVQHNGLVLANTATTQGDVFGFACDLDDDKLWVSRNGTWLQGDPATATSPLVTNLTGTVYPAACPWKSPHVITMRFDPASHSYSAPSGFTAGWTAVSS